MKLTCVAAIASVAIVPVLLAVQPAKAQEAPGCFMINSAGRMLNLTAICRPDAQPTSQQTVQGILEVSATAYADAWCEARAEGKTLRQASRAGTSAAVDYIGLRIPAESIPRQWFDVAHRRTVTLCPEYQPTGRYN